MVIAEFGKKNCHVEIGNGVSVFYSYVTPVIVLTQDKAYVTTTWHSVTTSKHINQFLRQVTVPVERVSQDDVKALADAAS